MGANFILGKGLWEGIAGECPLNHWSIRLPLMPSYLFYNHIDFIAAIPYMSQATVIHVYEFC